MNNFEKPSSALAEHQDSDKIDLAAMIDTILDAKWVVLAVIFGVLLLASAYAFMSSPIYQANILIQVEKGDRSGNNVMGEVASLFDLDSPATAEMEILRSRLVVGKATDQLQLYISAEPDYLPIIGRWLGQRSTQLSNPGIFGIGGYVSGNEKITIRSLEIPKSLEGKELFLKATEEGFLLLSPSGDNLATGPVGTEVKFVFDGDPGHIFVETLSAKPGARFIVSRSSRLRTISNLQRQLNITEQGKQSGIILATLEGINPNKTAEILNAVGDAYVHQNIQRRAAEAEKSLIFLDSFLPQLKQQMEESETEYTKFRDEHGTFNLGAEGEMSLKASAELQTKLLELEQKRRELAPRFKPAHPAIKTLDDQIDAIHKELNSIEQSVRKLPDLEQQLLSRTRNVQVNSQMYVHLLNSAQQLRLVKEGKVGSVRVVDAAAIPEIPVKPKKPLVLVLGLLFGGMLAIAVVFVRSWFRPGIKDSSEIENILGLHVFASIPHSEEQAKLHDAVKRKTPGSHVLARISPQDPAIESLRSLRTALQFALLEAKNNLVVMTGPTPSIGKSFTSVNFAAVLGAAGKRILLIDTDMRKGHINQYFNLSRENGLSDLITGNISINEGTHREVLPNVDFISTGVLPPNPAELLQSQTTQNLLKSLSDQYDLVVLDTAPVLAVSDALSLAPQAGVVFVLARSRVSTLGEIDESVKRIKRSGSDIKGVIFNDLVPNARKYSAKYGYYRYVNYGYGQDK